MPNDVDKIQVLAKPPDGYGLLQEIFPREDNLKNYRPTSYSFKPKKPLK